MQKYALRTIIFSLCLLLLSSCGGGGGGGGGCASDEECSASQFCKFTPGTCGNGGESGECTEIPAACTSDVSQVCSCEGLSFFNECFADAAAQSVASAGDCP